MTEDPDEQRVQEAVLQKLAADPNRYLLNADNAATLFEEYNQDRARIERGGTKPI